MKGKLQIALLCPGGQTDRWSSTLTIHNHNRRLRHSCQAQSLYHETKSPSGRGCHGPYPGESSSNYHVDSRNLIFRLNHNEVKIVSFGCHIFHYGSGWSHGIRGHKLSARRQSPQSNGLIAVEQHPLCVACGAKTLTEIALEIDPGVFVSSSGRSSI